MCYLVLLAALWASLGCAQRPETFPAPEQREWKMYAMGNGPAVYCAKLGQSVIFRVGNSIAVTDRYGVCP